MTGDDVKISFFRTDTEVAADAVPQPDLTLSTKQRLLRSVSPQQSGSRGSNTPSLSASFASTSGSLVLSPTKPKGEVKLAQPRQGKDSCAFCFIGFDTEMDEAFAELNGMGSWLGCSVKTCKWFAHARCMGFTVLSENKFEGFEFLCKKHSKPKMPGAPKSSKKAPKKAPKKK